MSPPYMGARGIRVVVPVLEWGTADGRARCGAGSGAPGGAVRRWCAEGRVAFPRSFQGLAWQQAGAWLCPTHGRVAAALCHCVMGDGGDRGGHPPTRWCWGCLYRICFCHVPCLSSPSFTNDECDPKHPTERPWSGEDMGVGSGAWRGEVCVCRRDAICFLLSQQQQQLQTFGLMGFGSI